MRIHKYIKPFTTESQNYTEYGNKKKEDGSFIKVAKITKKSQETVVLVSRKEKFALKVKLICCICVVV